MIGRLPVNSNSWFSFIYMLLEKWSFNAAYLAHLTLGLIRKLTKKRIRRTKSIDDLRGLISCGEIELMFVVCEKDYLPLDLVIPSVSLLSCLLFKFQPIF